MQIYYLLLYFFTYGFLGWCTEVAFATTKQRKFVNRGFLNGPICPIYGVGVSIVIYFLTPVSDDLLFLYISSTILVTVLEGITGYLMDKIFHHKWWDYSNQPLNIGGYVCLIFSLVWGVACVVIVKVIHPVIHKLLSMIPFILGIVILCILLVVLFADIYVTASAILKLNRQLDAMERIAAELRELSDKLGESIHENVMDTMESQEERKQKFEEITEEKKQRFEEITEEGKQKLEEITEESRKRMEEIAEESRQKMEAHKEELRKKYEEISGQRSRVTSRLVKAFPKMQSRNHKEVLEELKTMIRSKK